MKADILTMTQHLPLMIEIARRAVELERCEFDQKCRVQDLHDGYRVWKEAHSVPHVDFNTPEWEAMKGFTEQQYDAVERAKRETYNAKRRLQTAIRRLPGTGGQL
ncbi:MULTISPECIES: hypothetical protein [unclassified Chelatococcus]|uniref:hypothetical protein n=1 Tax=unclassified Chelatococcus TaxID=2638111 RepID=UPI001BCA9465|nr:MULTISPECIES: hypothetical protein [unclassified Chelatococcus]MBS7741419.1 hypothetical protein [Chelatococcus sp. HY11]MBX3546099.1 hypothetical protein [Chelatococcus sp.]MCO5077253.1 hypothetical protein [Chelatococcus sp.]